MEDHLSIELELKNKLDFVWSFEIKLKNCSETYFSSSNSYDKIQNIKIEIDSLKSELKTIKKWRKRMATKSSYKQSSNLISLCKVFNEACVKVSSDFEIFEKKYNFDIRYIHHIIFTPGFFNLLIYDTETNIKSIKNVKIKQTFKHENTQTIFLPNAKVFIYGGINGHYFGLTYIFDLKTYEAKEMPNGLSLIGSGGIYHKNSIYLFGGSSYSDFFEGVFPAYGQRFDIKDLKWKEIPNLPRAASSCKCEVFKETILIYGCNWGSIYQYDILIQSYSEIIFNGKEVDGDDKNIFLFVGNSRAYIGKVGDIFLESEVDDVYKWKPIGSIVRIKPYQGDKKQILNDAILIHDKFQIKKNEFLRFDLARKEIQKF